VRSPETIDHIMAAKPAGHRRWCYSRHGCACMGCAVGVSRDEFIDWLERHGVRTRAEEDAARDRYYADEERLLKAAQ
jgi:hypothetical protein